MAERIIKDFPEHGVGGGYRTNIVKSFHTGDWFVGYGRDESCQFEGTWWDMICIARNILSSQNTRDCAPEFYHPEMSYWYDSGEEKPYEYDERSFRKPLLMCYGRGEHYTCGGDNPCECFETCRASYEETMLAGLTGD